VLGRNQPVATVRGSTNLPCAVGRLGHDLAAQSSRGGGPRTARAAAHSRDGAVARSPAPRWRLAGGKVLDSSTTAKRWMHRARWAEAGLTKVVARRQGEAAARGSVLVRGRVDGDSG
jgi:hypothetical protein